MRKFHKESFPPRCPFCEREIIQPDEIDEDQYYEFAGGRCACGAVYTFDPTARNGGAAMLEAMVFACHGDWDWATSISRGEDYQEARINHYNGLSHRVDPGAFGTLYFIRLIPHA